MSKIFKTLASWIYKAGIGPAFLFDARFHRQLVRLVVFPGIGVPGLVGTLRTVADVVVGVGKQMDQAAVRAPALDHGQLIGPVVIVGRDVAVAKLPPNAVRARN